MARKDFSPSELKTILHSKRANLYYLQHCRVLVKGGRVEYVTDLGKESLYWNIPIANTTVIMLGTGTSVTQSAMRECAKAGVLVGFCGGGGTPLFSGNEAFSTEISTASTASSKISTAAKSAREKTGERFNEDKEQKATAGLGADPNIEVSWLLPQSEYRPTQYLQQWVRFWFDDTLRLEAAKYFQHARIEQVKKHWLNASKKDGFPVCMKQLNTALARFTDNIEHCQTSQDLLSLEATTTKTLYKLACQATQYGTFTRSDRGHSTDVANRFLDHGNYLAYGLGATACWVIGIPHGLAVLHGKTRRGGLVFDVADIVKDALILPQAFIAAMNGDDEQEFRQRCLNQFRDGEALDLMIETLQSAAALFFEKAINAEKNTPQQSS